MSLTHHEAKACDRVDAIQLLNETPGLVAAALDVINQQEPQ